MSDNRDWMRARVEHTRQQVAAGDTEGALNTIEHALREGDGSLLDNLNDMTQDSIEKRR